MTTSAGEIARLDQGVVAFIALVKGDSDDVAQRLAHRLVRWQLFPDRKGRIGQSLLDTPGAGLLAVPQFTLAMVASKGVRADFSDAMPAAEASALFDSLLVKLRQELGRSVQSGEFGAEMSVRLCNEGPVTFLLEER